MPDAATGPEELALDLRDVRKSFGDVDAVRDLSLAVRRGEILGFLGPNGAGKTTTIRMACGLLRPDGGEIRVGGVPLAEDPRACRRRIGLCPQELVVWDTLTCLEQLEFTARQADVPARDARARARDVLGVLGLAEKAGRLAKTLSGGMQRRLNLALALVHDPEILVLDEPQAGLDPQSRVLVREYVRSLTPSRTVLLTTHDMDEADRLADRVGIIDRGRLLVLDAPAALKRGTGAGEILELTLRAADTADLGRLLERLPEGLVRQEGEGRTVRLRGPVGDGELPEVLGVVRAAGIELVDLTLRTPTLEDVFIGLTGRGLRE